MQEVGLEYNLCFIILETREARVCYIVATGHVFQRMRIRAVHAQISASSPT